MNILITAGGNTEKIDGVRAIRNTGTGRLGALVAEKLALSGGANRVFYICDRHAEEPLSSRLFREFWERYGHYDDVGALAGAKDRITVSYADNVLALRDEVERVCTSHKIDAVVHSMAVSDYRVKNVTTSALAVEAVDCMLVTEAVAGSTLALDIIEEMASGKTPNDVLRYTEYLPEKATDAVMHAPSAITGSKLSSDMDDVLVVLERAPKVISLFRGLAPCATIIGFKLLSDVGEDELVAVGHGLLKKNDCDFVLANDMKHIREGRHIGHLISRDGSYKTFGSKDAIADGIVGVIKEK